MNIFDNIKIDKENENFTEIFKNDIIKIERIVSNGQYSPKDFWYEQKNNEFIILLDGDAVIEFEDKKINLKKGDTLNIPSLKKHRVEYTSINIPTIWLAIFY